MKYNQPYGISDPNAPYINGNPSTGTMGSIPPAASIEFPQREIANLITDCNFVGDNAQLHQLGQAIQSGQLFYGDDVGPANAITLTLKPTPPGYTKGMIIIAKVNASNVAGGVTLNANSLGARAVVHTDGSVLLAGDYVAGAIQAFAYDGTRFQLAWSNQLAGAPVFLRAPRDYYVANTGSDTLNDGLSVAKPFATIQHALTVTSTFNQNGFHVTIHVANGSYNGPVNCNQMNGQGGVTIVGNIATANLCTVSAVGSAFVVSGDGYDINGFQVAGSASGPDPGCGFYVVGKVTIGPMVFASATLAHICATGSGATVGINGPVILVGQAHIHCDANMNGLIFLNGFTPPPLQVNTGVTFDNAFWLAQSAGSIVGIYGVQTNPANVLGPKFYASLNGVINVMGAGLSYLPGSTGGVVTNGGVYG